MTCIVSLSIIGTVGMVRVKRVTQVKPGAPVVSAIRPADMAPITPPTSIGVE